MSTIDLFLLDNSNKTKEEINMIKPKTYQQLLNQIIQKFKNISAYYEIFIIDKDNKEFKINNEETYKIIEDILFIREINEDILAQSIFELNYNRLSESKQDILDEKYNCILCSIIIKNEKPYLCYKCQKIFHDKCLKDWDKKCKLQNKNLICPNCRNELPIEKWNKKLDYEENRKDNANLMNKINEYKLNNNMNDNINKIKDKKINELKDNEIIIEKLLKKYENYINETIEIFKNILNKINNIHNLMKLENNNKINNLLNNFPLNIKNLNINAISTAINEELDNFNIFIRNNININKNNRIIINENRKDFNLLNNIDNNKEFNEYNHNFNLLNNNIEKINESKINEYKDRINLIYFVKYGNYFRIFGDDFVNNNRDKIELIINGKRDELVSHYNLKDGENIITLIIKRKLVNLSKMFYDCKYLKDIKELEYLNVNDVKDFSDMFNGCSSLTNIKALEKWNVSNGNKFKYMFNGCSSLSNIIPLQNWNVSNCKDFSFIFSGCSSLSDIKSLQCWNVSNGNNFSNMFKECSALLKKLERFK